MSKQRQTELMAVALQKIIKEQKASDMRCNVMHKINQKADKRRFYRHNYLKDEEEEMYKNMQKAKDEQLRRATELEQEQKLAQAMAETKHGEILEIKTNHLLHKNCHELRHVENQLQTAYAKKDLRRQIKEKETIRNEEKLRDYYDSLKMIEAGNNEKRAEEEKQVHENELKLEYKKAILEQKQEMKERQKLSSVSDPTDLDQEEINHRITSDLKKKCFQEEIEEFIRIKKELNENKRREENKTDERIKDFLTSVEKRAKQQEEMKEKKRREKEKIYNCLVDNLKSLASDSEKKHEMQIVLVQEQQLHAAKRAEKDDEELKRTQRDEMLKQNERQLKMKKDSVENQKQNDIAEVKKRLRNFQNLNELEEKKNRERRQMMLEYGKQLKKTIDERNCIKMNEKTMAKNEYSDFAKSEELRLTEIAKKRTILVEQHMENLKGFFPPSSRGQRDF